MIARPGTLAANGADEAFRIDPRVLQRVADRASGLDQLRGLIIAQKGEVLFAKAFRGPSLDRSINVKSVSKTIVAA